MSTKYPDNAVSVAAPVSLVSDPVIATLAANTTLLTTNAALATSNTTLAAINAALAALQTTTVAEQTTLNSILAAFSALATHGDTQAITAAIGALATQAGQAGVDSKLATLLSIAGTAANQVMINNSVVNVQTSVNSLQTTLTSVLTTLNSLLSRQSTAVSSPVSTNVLLTSVVVMAANPNRKGFIVYNNSANSVYLTFGATSASGTCTRLVPTFASWEVYTGNIYTGIISGIRNAGSGAVIFYELI